MGQGAVIYNAFISYSHAADGALAPALRDGLQRFATPWRVFHWINPVRSLRIFQDRASLSANPALWPTIEQALSSAEWFILFASPEAAASPWVGKEVEYWRARKPVERLLIVQTDGEIAWNAATSDFDWAMTTALPAPLAHAFAQEPRWIDARWAHSKAQSHLRDPRFRDLVAELASPLRGVPKDELIGEDIRQYHRLNRWRNAAFGVLSVLLIGALTAAAAAVWQRNLAVARLTATQLSQSRAFATIAEIEAATGSPGVAVRAALAGLPRSLAQPDRAHVLEAEIATLQALRQLRELRRIGMGDVVTSVAFSPDWRTVATGSEGTTARLWDVATGEERITLRGDKFFAFDVSFSPDGRTLATRGSVNDTIRLWEWSTGREIATLPGASVAFSPDGRVVATASTRQDNTARVWDATTGKPLATLRGHRASVHSVAFSPDSRKVLTTSSYAPQQLYDGRKVLAASDDMTARVWDAATGEPLAVLRGHGDMVMSAVFSPDGARVLTRSADHTARLWDPASGRQLAVLHHDQMVSFAVFSPDGKKVLTASDHTARLWTAAGGEIAVLPHEGDVNSAGFSPDSRMVVTGSAWDADARSGDNAVRLWDATNGKEISALRGHASTVGFVAFRPDGQVIATVSENGVTLWNTIAEVPVVVTPSAGSESAAFSPDGKTVLAASYDGTVKDHIAHLWHAGTGRELVKLPGRPGSASSAVFSPDGKRVVTICADHWVRVSDATTGKELAALQGHERKVVSAVFSQDGTKVLTASEDHTARLWDPVSGKQLSVLRHGDEVNTAVFSPDGKKALTASQDQTARLWNAATGAELFVLKGHTEWVRFALFSPTDQTVLTASWDGTARLWDATTGNPLIVFNHRAQLVAAVFSPDGRKVLTLSWEDPPRVWDVASGKELVVLRGHSFEPRTIAFSPDGRMVVTGSIDHTARLWDSESGKELSVLQHEGWVNGVGFSADGGTLATVSASVRLWPMDQRLLDVACARVDGLPLSPENKKRLGITEEWCTPEVSRGLSRVE